MKANKRPYVYITDDFYVIPLIVSIKSLRKYDKESEVFVFYKDVSKQNIELLKSYCSTLNVQLRNVEKDLSDIATNHQYVSSASLIKFLLPDLLKSYNECIYLDCDILFLSDTSYLNHLAINDYLIAASVDKGAMKLKHNLRIGVKKYFNSGVMVINLYRMRVESIKDQLIKAKKELIDSYYQDQDAFNYVCDGKVFFFSEDYNYLQTYLPEGVELEKTDLLKDIKILHLTNKKPWIYSDLATSKLYKSAYESDPYLLKNIKRIEYNKVSIIVPIFNVDKYLDECIDSIVNQTFKNIEIILINDGSTDNSLQIAKKYQDLYKNVKLISQNNRGLSAARNAGLEQASGEFIFFIDSDDKISPYTIEHLFNSINKENSDFSACSFQYFSADDLNGEILHKEWPINFEKNSGKYKLTEDYENDLCCVAWNKLYRLSKIKKNSLSFVEGIIHEDISWLWSYLSHSKNYSYVNERLYYYRIRSESITSEKNANYYLTYLEPYKWILNSLKTLTDGQRAYILYRLGFFSKLALRHGTIYQKLKTFRDYLEILHKYYGSSLIASKGYLFIYRRFKNLLKNINFSRKDVELSERDLLRGQLQALRDDFSSRITSLENTLFEKKLLISIIQMVDIPQNSVLIIESQDCHGECLPSVIHYFKELGYHVDVWLSKKEFDLRPVAGTAGVRIFPIERNFLHYFLSLPQLKQYKCIFWNTEYDYYSLRTTRRAFMSNCLDHPKVFYQCHSPEFTYDDLSEEVKFTLEVVNEYKALPLYSCYFGFNGQEKSVCKNEKQFVVVGNIEQKRKDFNLLMDVIKDIDRTHPHLNFRITVIARKGKLHVPRRLTKYFNFVGMLDYPKMYEIVSESDFILPLLNSKIPEHSRYLTNGISGTVNLSVGLRVPMVIEAAFAAKFGVSVQSALIYDKESDFKSAFIKAIELGEAVQKEMSMGLSLIQSERISRSLESLKIVLK